MPTDWVGVLLFATLLVPGFVHRETRRTLRPMSGNRTAFEQTVAVISVSVVVNAVVGLAVVLLRLVPRVEAHSPDLAALADDFGGYLWADNTRTAYVAAWAVAYVVVASLAAFGLAHAVASEHWAGTIARSVAGPIRAEPAWYYTFEGLRIDGTTVWLGCTLDDGSHIAGLLEWFSTDAHESADRDVVLSRPTLNGTPVDAHHTVVSARRVTRIDVAYLSDAAVDELVAAHAGAVAD